MTHERARQWHARASAVIPGGVNSAVRSFMHPLPMHYTHARDAYLWDADGNRYIDFVLGQGPNILGHTPPHVVAAVQRQAAQGTLFAGQTEDEVIAAELLVAHIPCAEKVRFSTTGSEAVHAAIRLARGATGRKKVLRFEGHYHGWLDTIAWNPADSAADLGPRAAPPFRASSRGQTSEDAANLVVRPWNDIALLQQTFAEHGESMAALICDPFACAAGLIPADPAFLEEARRLCTQHGVVLIFDEVITGFRAALGGAQAYYGVTPDCAVFAKALGNGYPVAALAGRAHLMDEFTRGIVHAGTYNSNSVSMAATRATLEMLIAEDGAALRRTHGMGMRLMSGLETMAAEVGMPLEVSGVGAVFSTRFPKVRGPRARDFRAAREYDQARKQRLWTTLLDCGVLTTRFGIWFLSSAHSEADIDATLAAARAWFQAEAAEG